MATPDYSSLDAEILTQIAQSNRTYTALVSRLENEAKVFCTTPKQEPWRVINRRLQALRKKGQIGFNTKLGWRRRNTAGEYID
ncbi:hypothetical protein [Quatrionicoccus australiensis]|uniref:hypothetical protein n=1 Tax=Quatrionicoccus australiensis TaxID=138118 RepID=UPI001CF9418C|nr:hypothetical protein [Quatrionicoccus australiensis]MCB4361997.1 hypothetical protein [Quatrionicoccus australiensis]